MFLCTVDMWSAETLRKVVFVSWCFMVFHVCFRRGMVLITVWTNYVWRDILLIQNKTQILIILLRCHALLLALTHSSGCQSRKAYITVAHQKELTLPFIILVQTIKHIDCHAEWKYMPHSLFCFATFANKRLKGNPTLFLLCLWGPCALPRSSTGDLPRSSFQWD